MTKRMPACLSAAVALVVGLALTWPALGQGLNPQRDFSRVPNVYGGGSLFVYSGLDGRTSWQTPVNATTLSDGLGFRFDLPKGPTLRSPGAGARPRGRQVADGDLRHPRGHRRVGHPAADHRVRQPQPGGGAAAGEFPGQPR